MGPSGQSGMRGRNVLAGGLAALLLTLAACGRSPAPEAATEPGPAAPPPAVAGTVADDSTALSIYYAEVERKLIQSGRLRRETAPADAPFNAADLVRDFEQIAFFSEYADVEGRFVAEETPAILRRWTGPIRVGVMTGAGAPAAESARDQANVAAFTQRLSRLTGADIAVSDGTDVNFLVLFMNSAERAEFADRVATRLPGFAPAVTTAMRETPLNIFCVSYAFGSPAYSAAIILIRSEHPPLTRLSCVHEEMAQSMGLPNDSMEARPSLFNDGKEFALLTQHDEALLRMLYDRRLRPGMTIEEARPLLPEVARDAMATGNSGRVATLVN